MSGVNYLFVVVLASMIWGIIKGYKKGFLRLVVHIVGLILIIVIVTKVSPIVSDYLMNNTPIYEDIRGKIVTLYSEKNGVLDNTVPENQNLTIESYGLPKLISSALVTNNTKDTYSILAAALFEEYISGYLAKIVIKAGSYFVLFVILSVILMCILGAIKILEKIPVLKHFNKILGMLAGLSITILFVWVFYIGVMMFFADSLGGWLLLQVSDSQLLSFLFNNNLLFKLVLR